ncbi:hypothetical protein B0H17DRAFT_373120 [Mycena rosella]|uniref:Uncharacterized protein n=1 Tax=Mycena rosella TaxID=1033263 RepID=A0AAD7CPK0_MYCRO|nr:hypothetical protein B0H17DRAFT_373120 [Mycena rosella]
MQAKFTSLSVVLSALFASQLVGAVPCPILFCPAAVCSLGQTAEVVPGHCCPSCVPCPILPCPLPICADGSTPVTQPGECCPSCVGESR